MIFLNFGSNNEELKIPVVTKSVEETFAQMND